MKTSTILAFLAGGLATSYAVPAPAPAPAAQYPEGTTVTKYLDGLPAELIPRGATGSGLVKRADGGVYLCNDRNFSGYCVHIVQPLYKCVNLGGDLNDQVTSLGPDNPFYCLFYNASNCNDSQGHFGTYGPGYPDLSVIGWNDKISSYICYAN